ncbi:MAG: hypothetical protein A3H34_01385 [Betaproteobacteria bacterium RIFCSPLOWO2_02_FULL_67_19]|nr:MAG: hypothetical protein A3H34_01385 [Betaproteobacteria bacterium RIFCSPLOWO2_02_FULL_67_19]
MGERQLLDNGDVVPLGGRAFEVLTALVEYSGKLVTKEQLFERAWPGVVVEENNLQVQISTLRKVLGQGAIATVSGQGYRLVLEATEIGPGAIPAPAPRKHNLPKPLTGFIGHEQDLGSCAQLLEQTRLLTLIGIGGCGKTRFAIQLAEQVLPAFRDGVWFVDLAPVAEATHVPFTVATRLRIREVPDIPLEETLSDQLANQHLLLILDNCEHLLESCAQLAQRLLQAAPNLRILATSRESLGVAGEQIVTVRSLNAPQFSADHDIDLLSTCEAVRLFVGRARLSLPTFALNSEIGPGVADICRRLDGIPLAIELAAARVAVLSVEQIRSRLNERFSLLVGGARALPRHRTLAAVMQWSYEHLASRERQLVRRLSVFAGGWTLDAATAMAGSPVDQGDVLTLLSGLIDKSLVEVERHGDGEPHYRMLETVRQYMFDRLEEVGETSMARTRHLQFFLDLAEAIHQSEFSGNSPGSFVPRLSRELDNILAAHSWCDVVEGGSELGLRLVNAVQRYWVERRHKIGLPPAEQDPLSLGYRLVVEALARPGAQARTEHRCRALYGLSSLAFVMRRHAEAEAHLVESMAIARELGDNKILAARTGILTMFYRFRKDFVSAKSYAEETLSLARQSEDKRTIAIAYLRLGEVSVSQNAMAEADSYLAQSVAFARESCPPIDLASILVEQASAIIWQGAHERAIAALREARPTIDAAKDKVRSIQFLTAIAALAALRKNSVQAARFCGAVQVHAVLAWISPDEEMRLAQLITSLKHTLGEADYAAAEAAGSELQFQEVLAEAGAWLDNLLRQGW